MNLRLEAPEFVGAISIRDFSFFGTDAKFRDADLRQSIVADPKAKVPPLYYPFYKV